MIDAYSAGTSDGLGKSPRIAAVPFCSATPIIPKPPERPYGNRVTGGQKDHKKHDSYPQ